MKCGDPLIFIKRVLGILDDVQTYNFKQFLSGFMRGSKIEDIKEDNAMSFLAWAIYSKRRDELDEMESDNVRHILEHACDKHKLKLEPELIKYINYVVGQKYYNKDQ
jgi:hypothetical protein